MAYEGVVVREDGSLYCDIDVESLGYKYRTPSLHIPIKYDANKFREMADVFVANARSTCPVDTGFLRDHNDAHADQGGVEMWSEATYSVYQEYGTSRMRAQPWFESSVQLAVESTGVRQSLAETYNTYLGLESELVYAQSVKIMSTAEGYEVLRHLRRAKEIADGIGFPTEEIDDAIADVEAQIEELIMLEQMASAMPELSPILAMLIQIIAGIIVGLISTFIENLFDFGDKEDYSHTPTH